MISSQHRDLGAAAVLSCCYSHSPIREHLQGAKGRVTWAGTKLPAPHLAPERPQQRDPSIPLPSLHRPTTYLAL